MSLLEDMRVRSMLGLGHGYVGCVWMVWCVGGWSVCVWCVDGVGCVYVCVECVCVCVWCVITGPCTHTDSSPA